MEKLTLKETAGYLPYKLELMHNDSEIGLLIMDCAGSSCDTLSIEDVPEYAKPILHRLEMLTKTIVHNGVEIVPIIELEKNFNHFDFQYTDDFELLLKLKPKIDLPNHYFMADDVNRINQMLCEWHIDYQNLIPRGLAVSKTIIS